MKPLRNRWMACLALGALVLSLVGAPWLVPAEGRAQGDTCADYVYREDAQAGFQDPDACPNLPSRDTAPTPVPTLDPTPVPTLVPTQIPTLTPPGGQGYACSDYIYREDAQSGFQDPEACPELPSKETAPTCGDFATQAEAQAFYNQDPYRYWTLTDQGRGIGTDATTACPELAGAPPVVGQPTPDAPVTAPVASRDAGDASGISASADTESTSGSAPAGRVSRAAITADAPDGSDAVIFPGTCDNGAFDDPMAELTDVVSVAGEATGAGAFSTVATSFSTVDLALDELLADDHVLVVFDELQTERALSCGPIGGMIADDGSLAIGLRETPGAGWSGVAYLMPDADGTSITIFLAQGLAATSDTSREG